MKIYIKISTISTCTRHVTQRLKYHEMMDSSFIYMCVCVYIFFYKTPKSTGSFSTWLLSLHKNKHKKLAARIHSTELIFGKAL